MTKYLKAGICPSNRSNINHPGCRHGAGVAGVEKFQNQARIQAGPDWVDSGLVFTRQDGSGWHPSHVSDWFARISRAAGLPPITLHGLRHGAASMALAAGTDVKVVSAELGHSTAHFTQDTYQTVFPDVAKAAAEATAALLRGAVPARGPVGV